MPRLQAFDLVLFTFFFVSSLLYGRLYDLLGLDRTTLYALLLVINLACAAWAAASGVMSIAIATVISVCVLVFYVVVFSLNFDSSPYLSILVSYSSLMAIGVMWLASSRLGLARTLFILFASSVAYGVLHVYFTLTLDPVAIAQAKADGLDEGISIIGAHSADDSGDGLFRLRISNTHAAFGVIYAISRLKSKISILYLAFLLFFAFLLLISDFRFLLAAVALIGTISILDISGRMKSLAAISIVSIVPVVQIVCLMLGVNYYEVFSGDESAAYRAYEFDVASRLIEERPFFGYGLFTRAEDAAGVPELQNFFASDISFVGTMAQFGLVGLFAVWAINVVTYRYVSLLEASPDFSSSTRRCVVDWFLFSALFQVLAPYVTDDGGGLLFALAFSGLVIAKSKSSPERSQRLVLSSGRRRPQGS